MVVTDVESNMIVCFESSTFIAELELGNEGASGFVDVGSSSVATPQVIPDMSSECHPKVRNTSGLNAITS